MKASPESVSQAGEGAVGEIKGQVVHANIWNQAGDNTYPIASFTYLIVYKDLNNVKTREQAQALAEFLWWATHDGEKLAASRLRSAEPRGAEKGGRCAEGDHVQGSGVSRRMAAAK